MSKPIVIAFVPGTTASVLVQDIDEKQKATWPDILTLNPFTLIKFKKALENDEAATATELVSDYPFPYNPVPCYGSLLQHLRDPKRYPSLTTAYPTDKVEGTPEQLFFMLPYDWRVDNRTSASKVAEALNILDNEIYPDTDYDLFITSHSNGGLVSRYMVEKLVPEMASEPRWYSKLQKMITLATPHLGSPLAWVPLVGQQLSPLEVQDAVRFVSAVVDNCKFPSTTQLLPPESDPFISGPNNKSEDVYSPDQELAAAMTKYGVNTCNIVAASELDAALDLSTMDKTPVPYIFMYGSSIDTLANTPSAKAFTFNPDGADSKSTFIMASKAGNSAGDGVVPAHSASAGAPAIVSTRAFPNYNHGQMGGSDMEKHPDAIHAMMQICGIAPVQEEKAPRAAE